MPEDKGKVTGLAIRYIEPGDGDPRHGTTNGYCNLRCRCAECRGAWKVYVGDLKKRRVVPPLGDRRHGRESTYLNYGCRCAECTAAHTANRRSRRDAVA